MHWVEFCAGFYVLVVCCHVPAFLGGDLLALCATVRCGMRSDIVGGVLLALSVCSLGAAVVFCDIVLLVWWPSSCAGVLCCCAVVVRLGVQ